MPRKKKCRCAKTLWHGNHCGNCGDYVCPCGKRGSKMDGVKWDKAGDTAFCSMECLMKHSRWAHLETV